MDCLDQIRPDWEAKLAAVRAAVTRRANRRIIMRQVGDRLIPVGVTSGRVHTLPSSDDAGENGEGSGSGERGGSRRSRRRQNQELNQLLGQMGMAGQDLEEVGMLLFSCSLLFSITLLCSVSPRLTDTFDVLVDGHGSHASFTSRARRTTTKGA